MNLHGAIYKNYGVAILRFGMRKIRRYPLMPILRTRIASGNKRQRCILFSFSDVRYLFGSEPKVD